MVIGGDVCHPPPHVNQLKVKVKVTAELLQLRERLPPQHIAFSLHVYKANKNSKDLKQI